MIWLAYGVIAGGGIFTVVATGVGFLRKGVR